jgi:hypothetical protein
VCWPATPNAPHNHRAAGGLAAKQQALRDKPNTLRCWYVWREWAQRKRRLAHLALRLQTWYVQRWLLGRAWDRWAGQARQQYRTLVAERAERLRQADAASLQAAHAQEAAALRCVRVCVRVAAICVCARAQRQHGPSPRVRARRLPGRSELEGLRGQLATEAAARNRMEEEMKRSFMRGA